MKRERPSVARRPCTPLPPLTPPPLTPTQLLLPAAEPAILKHLRYAAADARALVEGADFFVLRDDAAGGGVRPGGSGLAGGGGVGGTSFKRR